MSQSWPSRSGISSSKKGRHTRSNHQAQRFKDLLDIDPWRGMAALKRPLGALFSVVCRRPLNKSADTISLGSAIEFFEKNYQEPCIKALQVFSQQCWPCEYEFEGNKGRCVNTLARHQKGHQMRGRYPKQQPGDYFTTLPIQDLLPQWLKWIYNWIAHFQTWLKTQTTKDTAIYRVPT